MRCLFLTRKWGQNCIAFKSVQLVWDPWSNSDESHRCVSCLPSFAGMTDQWPPRQKAGRHGWPAGRRRGEGRRPKMQTFHLRYNGKGIFSLSPGLQVANSLSQWPQKQPLFSKIQQEIVFFGRQWRRLDRKIEAYNDEMVSPLFALISPNHQPQLLTRAKTP